jgi:hypothetical protein
VLNVISEEFRSSGKGCVKAFIRVNTIGDNSKDGTSLFYREFLRRVLVSRLPLRLFYRPFQTTPPIVLSALSEVVKELTLSPLSKEISAILLRLVPS